MAHHTRSLERAGSERLSPEETSRGLRISIIEGILATVHIAATSGPFVTGYALMLGATDFQIGLLASLPPLSQLFQIFSAYALERVGSRKAISAFGSTARLFWILFVFLPFIPFLRGAALLVFLLTIAVSNVIATWGANAWTAWMSDLVPVDRRGRYFGVRNTVLGVVSMATNIGAGRALDHFRQAGREPAGFAVIFGVAVLFAALALLFLLRQPEPRMKPASQASLRELTLVPFGNRNFMRLTFFFSYWSVVTAIASPFYVVHMLKNLNMGYSHIAVYAVIAGVVTLVAQPVWGRVADRVGNRPVVLVNLLGIVILPLFWLFATPEFVLPIWGDAFLTGIFWPGLSLASFNLLLVACPEEARASYIAIFSAFSGVGTFLSALIGGALASVFSGFHLDVFGLSLINFHLLFIITSLGRLSAVIPLRTIQEPRAERVSVMLEWMSEALVKRLTLGRDTWMVVRRRQ